jgi:hypothetical protein
MKLIQKNEKKTLQWLKSRIIDEFRLNVADYRLSEWFVIDVVLGVFAPCGRGRRC